MSPTARTAPTIAKRAWVEQIMGMPISIHLRGDGLRTPAVDGAVAAVHDGLRAVDAVFSTWKPDSQISRIRRGELSLARADRQVREVAQLCERARELTAGAFDADLPDADGRVRFDPTGLVKGWAVQRAGVELASRLPGHDVLINAGGDIAVSCGRTDTGPWRLGIEDPHDRSLLLGTVEVRAGGLATSGTAARGAHIVARGSDAPASGLTAVSVAGPSLMWADVYATAAMAMGREGIDWLAGLPGHTWLVVTDQGRVVRS